MTEKYRYSGRRIHLGPVTLGLVSKGTAYWRGEPWSLAVTKEAKKAYLCNNCTRPIEENDSFMLLSKYDNQNLSRKRRRICARCLVVPDPSTPFFLDD